MPGFGDSGVYLFVCCLFKNAVSSQSNDRMINDDVSERRWN
jgi:hypothetical protein